VVTHKQVNYVILRVFLMAQQLVDQSFEQGDTVLFGCTLEEILKQQKKVESIGLLDWLRRGRH